ncbi:MAG TPA: nitrate reductase [Luteibacter sp.]|jgi:nitrate reductase NapE|uniref:periplasmic nitrate reductase, NapE protein n=1 Tax=Luteibacter sp. TaxID=1886636 RepID=UPI002F4201EE
MEPLITSSTKKGERSAFLLLTVALFPILAIALVVIFGFVVWFWQMFVSGPPGPPRG